MKKRLVFVAFLLLSNASAQQHEQVLAKGAIHGIVMGRDGKPSKGIGLRAQVLNRMVVMPMPETTTGEKGEYRFQGIEWPGRYTIYAQYEEAGYSELGISLGRPGLIQQVELSPEHPEAEFNFRLPPRAGFLQIHLTDQKQVRSSLRAACK